MFTEYSPIPGIIDKFLDLLWESSFPWFSKESLKTDKRILNIVRVFDRSQDSKGILNLYLTQNSTLASDWDLHHMVLGKEMQESAESEGGGAMWLLAARIVRQN